MRSTTSRREASTSKPVLPLQLRVDAFGQNRAVVAFMVEGLSFGTSWKNGTFLIGLRSSQEPSLHSLPSL
jgi:hypothetical protein